jgi:hypothetical protein
VARHHRHRRRLPHRHFPPLVHLALHLLRQGPRLLLLPLLRPRQGPQAP